MADAPTAAALAEFRRLVREASDVARSHDEYLALVYMAAVDLERRRNLVQ
jgi:hypothetical protein